MPSRTQNKHFLPLTSVFVREVNHIGNIKQQTRLEFPSLPFPYYIYKFCRRLFRGPPYRLFDSIKARAMRCGDNGSPLRCLWVDTKCYTYPPPAYWHTPYHFLWWCFCEANGFRKRSEIVIVCWKVKERLRKVCLFLLGQSKEKKTALCFRYVITVFLPKLDFFYTKIKMCLHFERI